MLCLQMGPSAAASALTVAAACVGLLLYLLVPKRRAWGGLLLGLYLLLTGMERMAASAAPLAETETFHRLMGLAVHPLAAVLVGTAVTGVLQSSSASIGLLQAFSATGKVPWSVGVPLVLGGNIGTCVTVLLASIGGGSNAKRAALAHLRFNLLGTAMLLPLWMSFGASMLVLEDFAQIIDSTVAGGLGTDQAAAVAEALAGDNAVLPDALQAAILAEQVADLAAAHTHGVSLVGWDAVVACRGRCSCTVYAGADLGCGDSRTVRKIDGGSNVLCLSDYSPAVYQLGVCSDGIDAVSRSRLCRKSAGDIDR